MALSLSKTLKNNAVGTYVANTRLESTKSSGIIDVSSMLYPDQEGRNNDISNAIARIEDQTRLDGQKDTDKIDISDVQTEYDALMTAIYNVQKQRALDNLVIEAEALELTLTGSETAEELKTLILTKDGDFDFEMNHIIFAFATDS